MMTKTEIKKIKRFLEEFSWLLERYSSVDLKNAINFIDNPNPNINSVRKIVGNYESPNPNLHFLTGVLPSLFMDTSLFKNNEDIAHFSKSVLRVEIPRAHKKSKYEIIGHIVCETNNLDDRGLDKLVKALSLIVSDDSKKNQVANRKQSSSYDWNEMIQELTKE